MYLKLRAKFETVVPISQQKKIKKIIYFTDTIMNVFLFQRMNAPF